MFTRSTSISKESPSNNLDLNSFELFEAISKGDTNKAKPFFYDPNIKIWNLKDENGNTVLHYSVLNNDFEFTKFIIEELKKKIGMSSSQKLENFINEKNKEGMTAIHYAVNNGNLEIVQFLKENGGNLDAVTNTGKNIMHMSAGSNQPSMLIYFLLYEAQDISSVDENGSTPLHWACYYGAEESVNYLLSLKVDIDAQDKEKFTPLHLAVSNNSINIVRLLLQKGANKNIVNNYKELPIKIAENKNYVDIVNILSNKDYNPLCTLELPVEYIKPNDIYKKIIFFMIIIPEIIIFILVLPFCESAIYYIINVATFGLCLLNYFILLGKEPGYQKNTQLLKECGGEDDYKPLKKLLENGSDLKAYCPSCYILKGEDKTHCFICNKCVLGMSHHCFWINKCIGKNNKFFYILFIFCSFIYAFYSLFICSNLVFDNVNIPYKIKIFPDWFYLSIDRGFRVLGAGLVALFSLILTFPLFFMFMIEMFKLCGLLGKKKNKTLITNDLDKIKNYNDGGNLEMQAKERLLNDDDEQKDNNDDNDNNKIKIPNENFPLVDERPSNAD